MSLAEALLRTPDPAARRSADRRAARVPARGRAPDELRPHCCALASWLCSARRAGCCRMSSATLTGRILAARLLTPVVAPIVRAALRRAMQMMGHAFIVGETIESALARGRRDRDLSLCSFDVLGEGARTESGRAAILRLPTRARSTRCARSRPTPSTRRSGISVKLSALEPRYSLTAACAGSWRAWCPRMLELARRAARAGIGFTIDAEEADRLDLSLDIIEALARDAGTRAWDGLGLAVQAYGRRAPLVLDWVAELAASTGRRMTVRLVKGAYWDSEIKRAQERGLDSFPVYTSKAATDASYLVCAQRLFAARDVIYPQFATHNAYTVAAVLATRAARSRLRVPAPARHGRGAVRSGARRDRPSCRRCASTRRSARTRSCCLTSCAGCSRTAPTPPSCTNSSTRDIPVEQVVRRIMGQVIPTRSRRQPPHPRGLRRRQSTASASRARSMRSRAQLRGARTSATRRSSRRLQSELSCCGRLSYSGGPLLSDGEAIDAHVPVRSPADAARSWDSPRCDRGGDRRRHGRGCARAQPAWDATPAEQRAACLERAAELLEQRRGLFLQPAGARGRQDAARCGRGDCARRSISAATTPRAAASCSPRRRSCAGPTGERNLLSLHGPRRVRLHQPVEFPARHLHRPDHRGAGGRQRGRRQAGAGDAAHRACHDAAAARGGRAAARCCSSRRPTARRSARSRSRHPALAGVAFTGSTATAATINRALAGRERADRAADRRDRRRECDGGRCDGAARAGGAMMSMHSAFTSAGQRCSALRVLYLQEEIADA